MHIGYSNGYNDALLDVLAWFDSHTSFFPKKAHKLIIIILRRLFKDRNIFVVEKDNYEFAFTAEEIKLAGIKTYLPEPPRWRYTFMGENAHYGYCPKCKQDHLFFTIEELLETKQCPMCNAELLPPGI